MREIKFEYKNLFPDKYFPGSGIDSFLISDEDWNYADGISRSYKLNPLDVCAMIYYSKLEAQDILHDISIHPLTEVLKAGGNITGLSVNTNKGTINLDDAYLIKQIRLRYSHFQKFGGLLESHLIRLYSYFEYHTKLSMQQKYTVIGMICAHCRLYKRGKKPLMTEPEWRESDNQSVSYKKYLAQNVKTWLIPFK